MTMSSLKCRPSTHTEIIEAHWKGLLEFDSCLKIFISGSVVMCLHGMCSFSLSCELCISNLTKFKLFFVSLSSDMDGNDGFFGVTMTNIYIYTYILLQAHLKLSIYPYIKQQDPQPRPEIWALQINTFAALLPSSDTKLEEACWMQSRMHISNMLIKETLWEIS